jgi:hypothetical protein
VNEEETADLRRRCQEHEPTKLRLYRDDEHVRDVPIKAGTRKRWLQPLRVVAELRRKWTSIELCDKADNVLDVYAPASTPARDPATFTIERVEGDRAELMRMMIAAQREVLTYRERDNSQAMQAMVAMMERVTGAVGALADVHARTLEAQRQHANVQLATMAQAAAAAASSVSESRTEDDVDESIGIVKAIAPQLGEKLAQGILEKFGPMIASMLQSAVAGGKPAAAAAKKPVIDVAAAANANGAKGAA